MEDDDLINAVEEFGSESAFQGIFYVSTQFTVVEGAFVTVAAESNGAPLGSELGADIAGHNDDRIAEINEVALPIGQPAVFQDLQQRIPHVGVRLLDFVKEDHLVWTATDRFCELASFVVADVAGRRAKEPADCVTLAVLAHINAQQCILIIEEEPR